MRALRKEFRTPRGTVPAKTAPQRGGGRFPPFPGAEQDRPAAFRRRRPTPRHRRAERQSRSFRPPAIRAPRRDRRRPPEVRAPPLRARRGRTAPASETGTPPHHAPQRATRGRNATRETAPGPPTRIRGTSLQAWRGRCRPRQWSPGTDRREAAASPEKDRTPCRAATGRETKAGIRPPPDAGKLPEQPG